MVSRKDCWRVERRKASERKSENKCKAPAASSPPRGAPFVPDSGCISSLSPAFPIRSSVCSGLAGSPAVDKAREEGVDEMQKGRGEFFVVVGDDDDEEQIALLLFPKRRRCPTRRAGTTDQRTRTYAGKGDKEQARRRPGREVLQRESWRKKKKKSEQGSSSPSMTTSSFFPSEFLRGGRERRRFRISYFRVGKEKENAATFFILALPFCFPPLLLRDVSEGCLVVEPAFGAKGAFCYRRDEEKNGRPSFFFFFFRSHVLSD